MKNIFLSNRERKNKSSKVPVSSTVALQFWTENTYYTAMFAVLGKHESIVKIYRRRNRNA